jgi:sugar phosphate isomerase/epimerase
VFKSLSPGSVGIRGVSLPQAIELAAKTGFGGVDVGIREAAALADEHGIEYVRDLYATAGLCPGSWRPPVTWGREDQWEDGMRELPKLAAVGQALGATRTATWITPCSDQRPFKENWQWHVEHLRQVAEVLKDHNCRLGLEFIGPKTSRTRGRYEFIHTLDGIMELSAAIGTGNIGLLLDAWHLYTSGGSISDLDKVTGQDIITVHVNDAPPGVALEEHIDSVRRLPMESGVIDLPGLLRKLAQMGYDGPLTAEAVSDRVKATKDPLEATRVVAGYMDQMWTAAGMA